MDKRYEAVPENKTSPVSIELNNGSKIECSKINQCDSKMEEDDSVIFVSTNSDEVLPKKLRFLRSHNRNKYM